MLKSAPPPHFIPSGRVKPVLQSSQGRRRSASQRTLKNPIHCTGIGLHSGAKVSMTLAPAGIDTGIVFARTDALARGDDPARAEIPASWHLVADTRMCTVLANEHGTRLSTVEHLMAALAGCEIDNLRIEIDGPELPVMDGSAAPFVFLIECAGTAEQNATRRAIEVLKPVSVGDDRRRATLEPGDGFSLAFEIDFDSQAIRRQECAILFDPHSFRAEIARARTFGFVHEIETLRAAGLAKGGSLDNAVVISGDRVLNDDGLRYADEFVRHKLLDAVGDLALAGAPLIGRYTGARCGHQHNNKLLRQLFADDTAWRWTTLEPAADTAGWNRVAMAANA
jgi:UDP-3-O-[3-hydroxymyristoyl] N-acetylglucosamine deacetylase